MNINTNMEISLNLAIIQKQALWAIEPELIGQVYLLS